MLDRVESALPVALDGVLDIVEGRLVEQVAGVLAHQAAANVCAALRCNAPLSSR